MDQQLLKVPEVMVIRDPTIIKENFVDFMEDPLFFAFVYLHVTSKSSVVSFYNPTRISSNMISR